MAQGASGRPALTAWWRGLRKPGRSMPDKAPGVIRQPLNWRRLHPRAAFQGVPASPGQSLARPSRPGSPRVQ
ncbi:hypothetical protein FC075_00465 [Salmonella enterica]|nr:hypothetical protein CHE29_07220 [Salmonella enterica]EAA5437416.1 hypothetical protein [Salmonella enterica subsp. diarizonae]EAW1160725.1 hypothetical protein [Salmonella enterica subsp. enterica]EBR3874640.1 hypothetical protein [Salmonella enterica subsp. arizonae]ECS6416471.1 hypothetical protein [Salmonella enterica subsp. diarizonae serovar 50:r:z]EGE5259171.1 hypothetical protein [Salmonella enterica subsp. diarizonae serovar 38:k:z]OSE52341.1 hypothetical protein R530_06050 [Salmo